MTTVAGFPPVNVDINIWGVGVFGSTLIAVHMLMRTLRVQCSDSVAVI